MAASKTRRTYKQGEAFISYITIKTMPEMLQKLIPKDVNPAFICTSYSHNKDKYNKALQLSEKEQKILSNLYSDGFLKCDTPLLYKLCQYYNFVSAPSGGWGTFNNKLRNIGDAVEAIVRLRNENVRNPTQDFQKNCVKILEIAKVVDKELSTDEKFEAAIKSLVVDQFVDKYFEEFKTAFKEIVEEATNGTPRSYKDDVLKEEEPMCFDEDYNPNVLLKPIVLTPDFLGKTDVLAGSKKSLKSRKRKSTFAQLDLPSLSPESEADFVYASSSQINSGT